jgi:hypothetical protein
MSLIDKIASKMAFRCQTRDLWYGPLDDERRQNPVIGFIPKYSRKGVREKSLPAFLIHPTSPHYDEKTIDEMLNSIVKVKIAFDKKCAGLDSSSIEAYICQMTPPR